MVNLTKFSPTEHLLLSNTLMKKKIMEIFQTNMVMLLMIILFMGNQDSECDADNFVDDINNDISSITNKLSSIDCESGDESQLSKTTTSSMSPKNNHNLI